MTDDFIQCTKRVRRSACVSVVIPVRDGASYLREAIVSALSQREVAEVIVVDDGSQDQTTAVVLDVSDNRVRYVRQDRLGAAAARNRGAELASGDLLAFLDADDLWLPGKLSAQIRALSTGCADIIFTGVEEFVSPELSFEEVAKLRPRHGALRGIAVYTMLMRTVDFGRVGNFHNYIRTGEFLEWYARTQELGLTSLVLPEVYARRRLHLANHGRQPETNRSEYASILRKMLQRRRQEPLS